MRLFSIFVVSILFMACSDDPSQTGSNPPENTQTIPQPPADQGPSRSKLVDVEMPPAAAPEKPSAPAAAKVKEQEITPIEEGMAAAASDDPSSEEITSLGDPLPEESELPMEDTQLIFAMEEKYSEYVNLLDIWEENSPRIEELVSQATSYAFLRDIMYVQQNINEAPTTDLHIEEMKDRLSEEGLFIYPEDRAEAQEMYRELDLYVNSLADGIQVSLSKAALAETTPSVIDQTEAPVIAAAPEIAVETPSTSAAATETAVAAEPSVNTDNITAEEAEPVAAVVGVGVIIAGAEAVQEAPIETAVDSEEDPAADEEPPVDTDNNIAAEEPVAAVVGVGVIAAGAEAVQEAPAEAAAAPEANPAAMKTDSAAVNTTETTEAWSWDWVAENTVSIWDSFVESITPSFLSNPAEYVLGQGVQLSVEQGLNQAGPAETTAAEENDENVEEAAAAEESHQLFSQMEQNVYQLVQTQSISGPQELMDHLTNFPKSAEERTAEQTALLNTTSQMFENISADQFKELHVDDFVNSSGYVSDNLSREEIIKIMKILYVFLDDSEEDSGGEEQKIAKTQAELLEMIRTSRSARTQEQAAQEEAAAIQ